MVKKKLVFEIESPVAEAVDSMINFATALLKTIEALQTFKLVEVTVKTEEE